MKITVAFTLFSLVCFAVSEEKGKLQQTQAPPAASVPAFAEKVDREVPEIMKDRHLPGVALVVVESGRIAISRGYGYADLETGKAVDPEKTIFRAGSVSKLLTATAVMQLAERNQLDLKADVNGYLRAFRVADTYPRPITAADLLTHTAGFAEYIHGSHTLDKTCWQPLGAYLARRLPPRIRAPGELFSYNDHGICLAGFLVEEISGIPFESYVEKNLFQPLAMVRSSFRQRVAPELQNDVATGYRYADNRSEPYALDYCQVVPAAALYTTAHDIARFMMAHLQYGRFGEVRILKEETAREMQQRHFAHHPKLRGRAYGFSELFSNGVRALFHDGGMPGFNTRLCLVPDRNIGFFVAWNSDDMRLKSRLTSSFFNHFVPQIEKGEATPPSIGVTRVHELGGYYEEVAGFSKSSLRLGSMLMNYVRVVPAADNTLASVGSVFSEIEPRLFRDKNGFPLAFGPAQQGRRQLLFLGTGALEKLPWYETPRALLIEAIAFALLFLPLGLIWPLGILLRRRSFSSSFQRQLPPGRLLAAATCFLTVFFLAGYTALFLQIDHYWQIMRNEFPWTWMTRLSVLPLITGFLSLGLPVYAAAAWIRKRGTVIGRVYYTLVVVSALVFMWILHNWNLLGFNY